MVINWVGSSSMYFDVCSIFHSPGKMNEVFYFWETAACLKSYDLLQRMSCSAETKRKMMMSAVIIILYFEQKKS